jgi:ferrous iron transport protein B
MEESLLKSLLIDGVIAGVGGVVIFLPQILILFFFILLLEDFGYMARAAFLMDRIMSSVGPERPAFIPAAVQFRLRHSRHHGGPHHRSSLDRMITILIAPLMTCSARLPVYVLLIAAFMPNGWSGITSACKAW